MYIMQYNMLCDVSPSTIPFCRDLSILTHYLQALSSLEYNSLVLNDQQRILDMMTDMCVEVSRDTAVPVVAVTTVAVQ